MKTTYPLISCICLSDNNSLSLQKAINDFELQNYPNKELIISFPRTDLKTKDIIANYMSVIPGIRIIEQEYEETHETALYKAINKSNGAYICKWNDGDRYHSSRLSYQYNSIASLMQGHLASILTQIILYDPLTKRAYLSFSDHDERSLLISKELFIQHINSTTKDSRLSLIEFLSIKRLLLPIENVPYLYVRLHNTKKTDADRDFLEICRKGKPLGSDLEKRLMDLL